MSDGTPSLRARTLAAVSATRSPTRPQGQLAARGVVAASLAVAVVVFENIGGFAHGAGRPLGITLGLAGGWFVVSALLSWLVLARSGTLARWTLLVGAAALAAPLALLLCMRAFYGTYAEPTEAIGYRCLGYTLLISALPLAGFLVLRRAVEPRYPGLLGAGAGAACASWAGALIDLWCPLTNTMHVLVGHVAPLVGATLVGAAAGHYTLGIRRFGNVSQKNATGCETKAVDDRDSR